MLIFNLPIEPISMRYSENWARWFSHGFRERGHTVVDILGSPPRGGIKVGSFLDCFDTTIYKAQQLASLTQAIRAAKEPCVVFLHDAWFPGIEAIAYIRDIAKVRVAVAGVFHAGSYDPTDLLGLLTSDRWADGVERTWLNMMDAVFVGTEYHKGKLVRWRNADQQKIHVTGNPVSVPKIAPQERAKRVIWPCRNSPDKRPDELAAIAAMLTNVEIVKTYDRKLSKGEYYQLLSASRVVLSTAAHENFGTAVIEGALLGCYPVVPNDLAYTETMPTDRRYATREQAVAMVKLALRNDEPYVYPFADRYEAGAVVNRIAEIVEAIRV